MSRALSTIAAGWLLVTYHGGTIAWYETKEDCEAAGHDMDSMTRSSCIRDRFAMEEMRRPQQRQETKP